MAILCQECEAIWDGAEIHDLNDYSRFEDYMAANGVPANWKRVAIIV
jgi:hypothetical protein